MITSASESDLGKKHALTSVLMIILILISLALITVAVLIFEPSKTPDVFQADSIPVVKNVVIPIVVPIAPPPEIQHAHLKPTISQRIVKGVVPISVPTPPTSLG
jgi:hypothetical protein